MATVNEAFTELAELLISTDLQLSRDWVTKYGPLLVEDYQLKQSNSDLRKAAAICAQAARSGASADWCAGAILALATYKEQETK
jgi:hypothetical protein